MDTYECEDCGEYLTYNEAKNHRLYLRDAEWFGIDPTCLCVNCLEVRY
jgi:hypothetical protein